MSGRRENLTVRVSAQERAVLEAAADVRGELLSEYVRGVLVAGVVAEMPNEFDRIAIALERLVELAEQAEPEMDVDIEIDADGKLMHVIAHANEGEYGVGEKGETIDAYVLAHDPDAAARAAKTWWSENGHVGITGVKVNYDE